ncbi:MAG: RraA family protein [Pseudomonadota bacterium]
MSDDKVTWSSDAELFELAKRDLFTSVVGDAADKLGFLKQYLPPEIKALDTRSVMIGRAMTVLEADVYEQQSTGRMDPVSGKPFGLMLEALDDLKENEVYICTGSSPRYALWGELMSLRATHLKAAGAVLDGYLRDANGIEAQGFPAFAYGSYGQDQGPRGKVIDYRVPIEIGGVHIAPGDIVFGDRDGVLVIPQNAEREIFEAAFEKARGEKTVDDAIRNGMGAVEAMETFGIL